MKQKKILALNSHSLSDYQHCNTHYKYNAILQIEPVSKKKVFELGTYWSKMLEIYYGARLRYEEKWKEAGIRDEKLGRLVKRMSFVTENGNNGFGDDDRTLLSTRIRLYFKFFKHENWIPVAVEKGFSFLLHEDENYLFIYEGRPDLIISIPDPMRPWARVLAVTDHKTRAYNVDLVDFNNQVNGYLCAAQTKYFFYNYCGKQLEGGPEKYFKRQIVTRSIEQLENWKRNTIKWYYRIAESIQNGSYLQSMQCEGKYGPCPYLSLCEASDHNEYRAVLNSNFKKREEERRSW